jgi:hypothetical protein
MVGRHTTATRFLAALGIWLLGGASVMAFAQARPPSEYQIKAIFLYEFGRFVEWPSLPQSPDDSFTICVLGVDPFGVLLDDAVKNKTVAGHDVVAKRLVGTRDAGSCHILFVSPSEEHRLPDILKLLAGKSILTVGEGMQFAHRGGMISFTIENNRVRFVVNIAAAESSELKMSSQLLKLATVVETEKRGS